MQGLSGEKEGALIMFIVFQSSELLVTKYTFIHYKSQVLCISVLIIEQADCDQPRRRLGWPVWSPDCCLMRPPDWRIESLEDCEPGRDGKYEAWLRGRPGQIRQHQSGALDTNIGGRPGPGDGRTGPGGGRPRPGMTWYWWMNDRIQKYHSSLLIKILKFSGTHFVIKLIDKWKDVR